MSNRWKIIYFAVFFNLLFEIALRGIAFLFQKPFLLLFIGGVYLLIFIALEDLIGRYKLKDYHFFVVALAVWLLPQILFLSPDGTYMLRPPLIFGINWPEFLFLVFAWYIFLQPFLALYIGNRLFPRTDYSPLLSKKGWLVWSGVFLINGVIWRIMAGRPFPNPIGYIVLFAIFIFSISLFWKIKPKPAALRTGTSNSKLTDIIGGITITLFLLLAIINRGGNLGGKNLLIDPTSMNFKLVILWSLIASVIFYGYRIISHRSVSI